MGDKLIVQNKKYGGETSVVSLRIPKTMISKIDWIASETGRTRNEIMTLGLEYALDNIETYSFKEE